MADLAVGLIAEDDSSIARVVTRLVENAGATPLIAYEWVPGARSSLLLCDFTDLMMPRLNGAGLVWAFREEATTRGDSMPPVILMTAASTGSALKVGDVAGVPYLFTIRHARQRWERYPVPRV